MFKQWKWIVGLICAAMVIYITSTTLITQRELARFVGGVIPGVTEDGFFEWWQTWWWVFVKGYHVTEFFALTLVAGLALRCFGVGKWITGAAVLAVLYACTDEWHQTFVPARGGRVTDVLIDCIGIGLAALLMVWRIRKASRAMDELPEKE
jgi:hypothetical protein